MSRQAYASREMFLSQQTYSYGFVCDLALQLSMDRRPRATAVTRAALAPHPPWALAHKTQLGLPSVHPNHMTEDIDAVLKKTSYRAKVLLCLLAEHSPWVPSTQAHHSLVASRDPDLYVFATGADMSIFSMFLRKGWATKVAVDGEEVRRAYAITEDGILLYNRLDETREIST